MINLLLRRHLLTGSVSLNFCTYLLVCVFFYCNPGFVGCCLLFLDRHLVRHEDTYGEVAALCAVLVLHQDAVFSRVTCVHGGNGEVGKLARLELEDIVVVGHHLSFVFQPGHLRHRVSWDITCQIQGLVEKGQDDIVSFYVCQVRTMASLRFLEATLAKSNITESPGTY